MASMFSSPSKQATSAAQAQAGISNQEIQNLEGYVQQQQQNLRGAISDTGANPYFTAAAAMNPSAYAVNPADTANFGASGSPGTMQGAPTVSGRTQANYFAPPPMPSTNANAGGTLNNATASPTASPVAVNPKGGGTASVNGFTNLSPYDALVAERQTEGLGA